VKCLISLAAFALLAGCSTSSDNMLGQGCEAQGLTPGTAAFEQCSAAAATPNHDLSMQHEVSRQMMMGR
jgi:uncharacterized lipoprotein YajG